MIDKNEYIQKILSYCEEGTRIVSEYINAHTKITLVCKNGHSRTTTSNTIISRKGSIACKECLGRSTTNKKLPSLVNKELSLVDLIGKSEYLGANIPMLVTSTKCGHTFSIIPSSIARGRRPHCKKCGNGSLHRTTESFSNELSTKGLILLGEYISMKDNVFIRNSNCGHQYSINPGHLIYDNIGVDCKVCNNIGSIQDRFFSKLLDNNLSLVEEYTTTTNPITVINNVCGHLYKVTPNNTVRDNSGIICRTCTPFSRTSKGELEVLEYITSIYKGWIETSDRTILSGKELDIVLPDLGIAFEYNGAYWHREDKVGSTYHIDKSNLVRDFGYKLIHINEEEWLGKPDIVKSRIRSILNLTDTVYARNCTVREIPFPYQFLDTNHIQGRGSPSSFNYGLFLKEELVAVMTFSKPRFNKSYEYELIRYCSLLDITIVGGASKLLKKFRDTNIGSIVTYSDKRWSIGNMYKVLGFTFSHTSVPGYKYHKGTEVLSRYQCQKHLLSGLFPKFFDAKLSELEILVAAGYNKVFDCGNDVWVLK